MTSDRNGVPAWATFVARALWAILTVLVIVVLACLWHPWTAWIP
jgi:hypothetical protein